jgi:tRNA-specific 2-thiouridylase
MLASLDPDLLERLWFPVGERSKKEIRAEALAAGLAVAERPESQEACFLAGDDYRLFLRRRGLDASPGPIVDLGGRTVGRHEGHWRYTPGQRRGLGVAAGHPVYAIRTEAATNTVVIGTRDDLARTSISVVGRLYAPVDRAEVKVRYRSPAVGTSVEPTDDGFRLELDSPAYGVAPGQTAVLYEDDAVVGAGTLAPA